MIAIIDYGIGNLFSVVSSFKYIGQDAVVTSDPKVIRKSDKLILPGVGAFGDAIDKLRQTGLDKVIIEEAKSGKLATFAVKILFRQNAGWQGLIKWCEGNCEESFRSVLEMLLLMNSALEKENFE